MGTNAVINLATVGSTELQNMPVPVFTSCLDKMSGEAIARFRQMRKLNPQHKQALEKYLVEHPEKRMGEDSASTPPAAKAAVPKAAAPKVAQPKTVKPKTVKLKAAKPAAKAAEKPAKAERKGAKLDFAQMKLHFRAWWEGLDVKDLLRQDELKKAAVRKAREKAAQTQAAPPAPAATPIEAKQMLWGKGFHLPGGEDFALRLVQNAELKKEHPCLDIDAGLGGGLRAIARTRGVRIEGVERDPALAAAGNALSGELGMASSASIRAEDPESMRLDDGRYGAIFAREALFTCQDRKKFLSAAALALTPGASLVITDYVLADRNRNDETLAAWRTAEPRKPLPATSDEYCALLRDLRYEMRSCEDLSAEYLPLIQAGWRQVHDRLQDAQLPPEMAAILIQEGDLWLARSRALESGRLKLVNFHAVMHRGPKRSMSDAMKID
jgi:SAM-dependent methyltransferase